MLGLLGTMLNRQKIKGLIPMTVNLVPPHKILRKTQKNLSNLHQDMKIKMTLTNQMKEIRI